MSFDGNKVIGGANQTNETRMDTALWVREGIYSIFKCDVIITTGWWFRSSKQIIKRKKQKLEATSHVWLKWEKNDINQIDHVFEKTQSNVRFRTESEWKEGACVWQRDYKGGESQRCREGNYLMICIQIRRYKHIINTYIFYNI